jgi:FixJ family two-component response regulator
MKLNTAKERNQSLISIVDDEACVRESLSSLIRSVGYKVEEFPSAESFLIEGKWDETACLILDVRLHGMGGLELQRRLTELGREHPPIVFISGHATEKEQTWAATAGAVAFLRKPFSDESLLNAVRNSVARSRDENTPAVLFSCFGRPDALTAINHSIAGTRQKV